jgi:hypothetical protein
LVGNVLQALVFLVGVADAVVSHERRKRDHQLLEGKNEVVEWSSLSEYKVVAVKRGSAVMV